MSAPVDLRGKSGGCEPRRTDVGLCAGWRYRARSRMLIDRLTRTYGGKVELGHLVATSFTAHHTRRQCDHLRIVIVYGPTAPKPWKEECSSARERCAYHYTEQRKTKTETYITT
jgi:hypothetical protein